jgi:gamma-glutamylcyclotransferase (GGCT)/AIG2-like uncharacterized protein YtfP
VHRLFVYGTLQHPPLLRHLLGRDPALEPVVVEGWRAVQLQGRVYPGLVPAPGGWAHGHVLEVDDGELAVLDRFEGPQYERTTVVARDGPAFAWRLRDEHLHLGLDDDWDLQRFVAEDAAVFLGASRPGDEHPWEP